MRRTVHNCTMTVLITFDIDGTLIGAKPGLKEAKKVTNSKHKEAISHGVKVVTGKTVEVKEVDHHGRTDREIIMDMVKLRGGEANEGVLREIVKEITAWEPAEGSWGDGLQVLPGVEDLLVALSKMDHVKVGLVTGNVSSIAWKKLDAVGIKDYFTTPNFGGFGGDFNSRVECLKYANTLIPPPVVRSYHFGDAPADISAATDAGVLPIGVTTGIFSVDVLTAASTTECIPVVFPNLADTDVVLKALQLL